MLWASNAYGFEPEVCRETLNKLFQLSKYQFQNYKKVSQRGISLLRLVQAHVESSIKFAIDFEATE